MPIRIFSFYFSMLFCGLHKGMKPHLLIFLFIVSLTTATSQVLRINHKELGQDTLIGWHGDFEVDFLLNNLGSTAEQEKTYLGFKVISNASHFSNRHQYYLKNELRYFKAAGNEFLNRGFAYFRINWNRKQTIHPESVIQVQFDQIRHLDLRLIAMQGLKLAFVKNDNHELDLGVGLMYEREQWSDFSRDGLMVTKDLMKTSSYVGWYTDLNNQIFLSMLTYYQVGYDQEDGLFRHRINGSLEISDKITDRVEWIVRFQVQYESAPIVPVAPVIFELMNGIKFKL